jgi:hypothetical protein
MAALVDALAWYTELAREHAPKHGDANTACIKDEPFGYYAHV